MRFRVARLSAILMVALLLDVRSGRAEIPPLPEPPPFPPTLGIDPMTEPQLRASLSVLQTFFNTFLTVRTTYPAIVASTQVDGRGRTVADDFTLPLLEGIRLRAERLDIEALEALAASPSFQGLYPLTANEPCDPPAARSSGKSTPSIDSSRPRANLVFPEESRRTRESGTVFVGVMVATTGCARQASVVGSSGYQRLDQAGARYAMTLRFLPAEKDGSAIERFVVVPINFKLTARNQLFSAGPRS